MNKCPSNINPNNKDDVVEENTPHIFKILRFYLISKLSINHITATIIISYIIFI